MCVKTKSDEYGLKVQSDCTENRTQAPERPGTMGEQVNQILDFGPKDKRRITEENERDEV